MKDINQNYAEKSKTFCGFPCIRATFSSWKRNRFILQTGAWQSHLDLYILHSYFEHVLVFGVRKHIVFIGNIK